MPCKWTATSANCSFTINLLLWVKIQVKTAGFEIVRKRCRREGVYKWNKKDVKVRSDRKTNKFHNLERFVSS